MYDPADKCYSPFEQTLALAWAQAHLTDFLRTHENSSFEEQKTVFLNAVEAGFGVALDLRK